MRKKRKPKMKFTEAFRTKALEMLATKSNAEVARELKISEPLLYAWKKRAAKGPPPRLGRPPKTPNDPLKARPSREREGTEEHNDFTTSERKGNLVEKIGEYFTQKTREEHKLVEQNEPDPETRILTYRKLFEQNQALRRENLALKSALRVYLSEE